MCLLESVFRSLMGPFYILLVPSNPETRSMALIASLEYLATAFLT